MGRFIRGTGPTRRIDLGDRDWVEIKESFTMADRAAINQAMVQGGVQTVKKRNPQTGEIEEQLSMGDLAFGMSNIATLVAGIVAWGGPGFCVNAEEHAHQEYEQGGVEVGCRPLPITEEMIRSLDEKTGEKILDAITKANPQPKEGSPNP